MDKKEYKPHGYQEFGERHILDNPYCGLFLDMGLGKTVTTLTAIDKLKFDEFEVNKVLVIAPLRVADTTWADEIKKWKHLNHLKLVKILGTEKERRAALRHEADIYTINRENVPWLVGYLGANFPFDMVVVDELSSFKNPSSLRFKSLRTVRPIIKRLVGLTGTPAPNGLIDLWSQLYLIDRGERLGKTVTEYRKTFFNPNKQNGHVVYSYKLKEQAEEQIRGKISDVCISMSAKDYLDLPERIDNYIYIDFPTELKTRYEEFEKKHVLELLDAEEISVVNAAALNTKLLQFANGTVYDDARNTNYLHDLKVKALEEILDTANGKPVLVFYSFQHDLTAIQDKLKKYKPKKLETAKDIEKWNKGEIQLLLAHPASAGHGLNLQAGGSIIVWFGLNWSLELYQQANARLHRQGQTESVIIHHLVSKGTLDEDVIAALSRKDGEQNSLLEAIKARIDKYLKAA